MATIWGLTLGTTANATDRIAIARSATVGDDFYITPAYILTYVSNNINIPVAQISDASANGRSLISSANYASMLGLLGVEAGATADQTGAQIKVAYEAEADTNALTDAEKTVLGNTSGTNTGDQTNITGNAATVTTNANLTGHVTSTGNAAVLGSFTVAQLSTALSDATLSGNNTGDQTNITGNAATVTTNANLTGHITSTGNAAILGSFTKAQLDAAVSDDNILYDGDITGNIAEVKALAIGTTVQAFDADILKADTADQLTAAFTAAIDDDGTITTSYTPSFSAGSNYKKIVNNSAFTLNAPTLASGEAGTLSLLIVNTTGAGAVTFSGFVTGTPTGDTLSTTITDEFLVRIEGYNVSGTTYMTADIVALQ